MMAVYFQTTYIEASKLRVLFSCQFFCQMALPLLVYTSNSFSTSTPNKCTIVCLIKKYEQVDEFFCGQREGIVQAFWQAAEYVKYKLIFPTMYLATP